MGVYIKGMEMPECCGYCPFEYKNYCMAKPSLAVESADRHPRCPLVPVPPHGRLGDLDELAKVVLNWITTQEKAYPNEDSNALSWRLGARAMGHQIYRDIEAAPTIIEADGNMDTDFWGEEYAEAKGLAEEGET